ncbi:hypothetical protein [Anaerobacillus alkalilacustris]|nr:hypothetical protein [Anaerobacillus alkalilacustris]
MSKQADLKGEGKSNSFKKESKSAITKRDNAKSRSLKAISKGLSKVNMK